MKNLPGLSLLPVLALSALFIVGRATPDAQQFPLIMWDSVQKAGQPIEFTDAMNASQALNAIKNDALVSQIGTAVILMKEGLTTEAMVKGADQMPYVREQVLSNSKVFTSLAESLTTTTISEQIVSTNYNLNSLAELNNLLQVISEDLPQQTQFTNYILITIPQSVSLSELNDITQKIEASLSQSGVSFMTVIVGTEASTGNSELLSLVQTSSRILATTQTDATLKSPNTQTLTCSEFDRTYCINQYINSSALDGIVIALFCVFFLIFGFLQLFYVQTPVGFVSQSIDFGKIEK